MVLLALIFYQDIRHRAVHFLLFLSIFLIGIIKIFYWPLLWIELFKIFAFILLNMIGLFIYYSFKNKTFFNPVNNGIGLGDVVFFIAVAPFFTFWNYMEFFISGLTISIALFGITHLFKKKPTTIPLAGYLSLYLAIIFVIELSLSKNILTGG